MACHGGTYTAKAVDPDGQLDATLNWRHIIGSVVLITVSNTATEVVESRTPHLMFFWRTGQHTKPADQMFIPMPTTRNIITIARFRAQQASH